MSKINQYCLVSNTLRLRIGLLIAAFVFAYFDTLVSLVKAWAGRNDYSHGFIVPFASLYFFYALRGRLQRIDIKPNIFYGSAVTLAGVLMHMLGKTGGIITIQQLSILVVLPGLIILLLGIKMFKALLLPLGYLVLMVPLILDVVFTPLHWPFQLFGANIAAMILSSIGIPVFHTAQFIELPNMPLEVANACSGIRYLVSIMALAVPMAYLTLDTPSKRIFLVGSSLLIGILANPIRIAIIGFWVYNGGSIVHGPGHILQGYFVSIVGYGFLFAAAWVMSRKQTTGWNEDGKHARRIRDDAPEIGRGSAGTGSEEGVAITGSTYIWMHDVRIPGQAWACALLIVLVAGIFTYAYRPVPVPLKVHKDKLPLDLEGWRGSVIDVTADGFVTLPRPDVELRVAYSGPSNETVYLLTGYYEYQLQDKEFIHHTLQTLYDGAKTIEIEVAPGQYIAAKQVLIHAAGKSRLVTYWYDMNGCITSNNIMAKFITALRGLAKWRTNGSIVLIASEITATDRVDKAAQLHEKFCAVIYPFLKDQLNYN